MILDDILVYRREQLAREKAQLSLSQALALAKAQPAARSFTGALKQPGLSVIAEVKKASPSKGIIAPDFKPIETAKAYEQAGAAAVSVLTEEHYFMGSNDHLVDIRRAVNLPLLRKDFVFDPYQVVHARALGADAVLLIVAMLERPLLAELLDAAREIGMAPLVEVHNARELETALGAGADTIGVNNRNLKTFQVSLEVSQQLIPNIPQACVKIVESGIGCGADMRRARATGADAVLVGESLMRSPDIPQTMGELGEGL